jgi:hypothetical protein
MLCKSLEVINLDKEALRKSYQMTDLGKISWILGFQVTRDRDKGIIALSQEKFILEILNRFNKSHVRPIPTPALANEHLTKLDAPEIDAKSFQRAVGALMYPMLGTRPDLAYAVGALGHHTANPGPEHQHALNCMFKYLQATSGQKLTFQCGSQDGNILHGFADADWASNVSDRKLTSGYVFKLAGGAVSWSSKKQTSVALSSTEAEYIAAAHAAKEAVWLRCFLGELGQCVTLPTTLYIDNQSAITITQNPEFHNCTKHIEVRYHFLRHQFMQGKVDLVYTPTREQVADTLTKGLTREKHKKFCDAMGVRNAA